MTDTDAQTVASSATGTPDAPQVTDMAAYAALRDAERAGKSVVEPPTPASAAGEPVEQAEEIASSNVPAPEPGETSGRKSKSNAETRKAELQAEIDSLLKQRAELRRETQPAAPAPAVEAQPASQPAPKATGEPTLADFEADPEKYPDPYAAYLEARADYRAEQRVTKALADLEVKQRAAEQERAVQTRADVSKGKVEAALAADPDLKDAIAWEQFDSVPSSLVAAGQTVTPKNDLAEAVLNADDPAGLMRYLSEQPKALAALLTSPDPRTFWRRLGQAEARLSEPKRPVPKTITDAPEPPPTVGTRVSGLSETDAALKAHDMSAFFAARDRERMAQRR